VKEEVMKKWISLLMVTCLLLASADLYANPGDLYVKNNNKEDKSSEKGNKSENSREDSRGKDKAEKNEKSEDAQKNWGKLKDDDGYRDDEDDSERKEAIKAERTVRREIKRNEDLEWDEIDGYSEDDLEDFVRDYVDRERDDEDKNNSLDKQLEDAGVSDKSREQMERAVDKYDAAIERIDDKREEEEEDNEGDDDEKIVVMPLEDKEE